MRLISTLIVLGSLLCGGAAWADDARLDRLERRLRDVQRQLDLRPMDPGAYSLPDDLTFCGASVPLHDPIVRERLERELLLVLGDRAQVTLWAKRAKRVFPTVEREARKAGVCSDLKYLAVVESGLRPAVTSHASASGWWQFMRGTAEQYGLDVHKKWDSRADLQQSTRAGLKYLKRLHRQFGDWPLAMVAYNTGPGRLRRTQKAQGVSDFWRLHLLTEASRYVPRVIAVKAVMSNLADYGFVIDIERDGWPAARVGHVKVKVAKGTEINLAASARGAGIDFARLKRLNPELKGDRLVGGLTYVIEVPAGTERSFRAWVSGGAVARKKAHSKRGVAKRSSKRSAKKRSAKKRSAKKRSAKKRRAKKRRAKKRNRRQAKKPSRYRVRTGDSLWRIAERNKISVDELRRWNRLGSRSILTPGQRLVVRR